MKVLFTSHSLEFPAHGGPELRITNTIKALSDVSDLFIINQIADSSSNNLFSTQAFCEKFSHKYLTVHKKQPKNIILKILYKILLKIFSIEPNNVSKEIIEFVKDNNIDIIWFGYGNISYPLIKSIRNYSNIWASSVILFPHESLRRDDNFLFMRLLNQIDNVILKKSQ